MWVCYTSSCLFHTVAATNHQLVGDIFWGWLNHYLTIIIILSLARMGSESIAHLAFGLTAIYSWPIWAKGIIIIIINVK